MAICDDCEQEMTDHVSCTVEALHADGKAWPLVRHGEEPGWETDQDCHDCGVPPHGLHHLGCDMQRCPGCGGQLICCHCRRWDEFAGEYDLDDFDEDDGDDDIGGSGGSPRWRRPGWPTGHCRVGRVTGPVRCEWFRC